MPTGAVLPHAPLLLLEPPPAEVADAAGRLRAAAASIDVGEPDVVVVLSSHGRGAGVYADGRGDLAGFGLPGILVERREESGIRDDLARAWGAPVLHEPLDHGALGALALLGGEGAVVCAALPETTGPQAVAVSVAREDASGLAVALTNVLEGRRAFVVASAHTSAALSPRAPLTERPGAAEVERRIVAAIERPGRLTEIDEESWNLAGACGAGPLTALGALFANGRGAVLAHEAPVGVGYVVAVIE